MKELDKIKEMLNFIEEFDEELKSIPKKQSEVDSKISDILHYCEFQTQHKSSEANKYWKMLKDLRIERRNLKDRLEFLQGFESISVNLKGYLESGKVKLGKIKHTQQNKVYKVRVLTEEFGEFIK